MASLDPLLPPINGRERPAPLDGVVVVETGSGYAAPFAGHLLASYGATVLRVEGLAEEEDRPPTDVVAPEIEAVLNAGKLGVSFDTTTPEGRGLLERMRDRCDVSLSFRGPERVEAPNERCAVNVEISWLGRSGPWSDYLCDDFLAQHMSGMAFTSALRMEDTTVSPPRAVPGRIAEMVAGLTAATAATVALQDPDAPRGELIDISVAEAIASFMRYEVVIYSYGAGLASRSKLARSPVAAPVFQQPAADGFVDLMVMREEVWRSLLEIIGSPAWGGDEIFATHPSRAMYWDALEPMLQDELRKFPADHLYKEGQARGIAISPINTIEQAASATQFLLREFFRDLQTKEAGRDIRAPGLPFKVGEPITLSPAPGRGQHNAEVLRGWLGATERELSGAGVLT